MDTGGLGGLGGDAASYWLSSSKGKIDISGNWKAKLFLDLNAINLASPFDGMPMNLQYCTMP